MRNVVRNNILIVLVATACVMFGFDSQVLGHTGRQSGAASQRGYVLNPAEGGASADEAAIQAQINSIYKDFYNSYRLGAGDIIGIHIARHPDDSVDRVVVSPVGQVYFPLLGNVPVAGKTMDEIGTYFTSAVSEYIKDPNVTLSLLEANSAKVGVLGDVRNPGVLILSRPMRVLDAVTAVGGITDLGNSTSVAVLRNYPNRRVQVIDVNVKRMLQGKGNPEENVYLASGDTIIVHGNKLKTLGKISSVVGMTSFFNFLTGGRL